jgi:hypothetical protein
VEVIPLVVVDKPCGVREACVGVSQGICDVSFGHDDDDDDQSKIRVPTPKLTRSLMIPKIEALLRTALSIY